MVRLGDEAIERGRAAVAERSRDLPVELQAEVGHQIGVGALKYAELSTDLGHDSFLLESPELYELVRCFLERRR